MAFGCGFCLFDAFHDEADGFVISVLGGDLAGYFYQIVEVHVEVVLPEEGDANGVGDVLLDGFDDEAGDLLV